MGILVLSSMLSKRWVSYRFDDKSKWHSMWFADLFIIMITRYDHLTFGKVSLFLRNDFCIKGYKFGDARDIALFVIDLVDFAAMGLIDSHMLDGLIVDVGLLLKPSNNIPDRTLLGNKDFE